MNKILGFSSLLLAAITFGSFGLWVRILNQELSIYQQIVLRNSFAFLLAFVIVFLARELRKIKWKEIKKSSLLAYSLSIPLAVIFYNIAIINTKIALATFAFYIGTIVVGWVLGAIIYKEQLGFEKWISLGLVFLGLGLFAYPFSATSANLGLLAGIVGGALDGLANSFRKDLAGKTSKFFLVLLTAVGGVIVSGAMIIYFQQGLDFYAGLSTRGWVVGALFGALLVLVNYLLLVGFRNFDLSLGSIVLSLELLFAVLFGMLFLQELPSKLEWIGGALILIANIIPNVSMHTIRGPRAG